MSVKIRLTKTGKRNQIQYRIVVQDTHTKRDGKFLEILGHFNPQNPSKKITLKKDEYDAWIQKGAKPTPSVSYLLENNKLPKKAKKVREETNQAAKEEVAPEPKAQKEAPQPEAKVEAREESKPEENKEAAKPETAEENKAPQETKPAEVKKEEVEEVSQPEPKTDDSKKPDPQDSEDDSKEQKAEGAN